MQFLKSFPFLLYKTFYQSYKFQNLDIMCHLDAFYPRALKGCQGIVFTHGLRMGGRVGGQSAGKSLSGLYLRNPKV